MVETPGKRPRGHICTRGNLTLLNLRCIMKLLLQNDLIASRSQIVLGKRCSRGVLPCQYSTGQGGAGKYTKIVILAEGQDLLLRGPDQTVVHKLDNACSVFHCTAHLVLK